MAQGAPDDRRRAATSSCALVTPFVYRKYLDFDALRRPARRPPPDSRAGSTHATTPHNVKLGPGGIREIEFIVQALQLVRGGREPGAARARHAARAGRARRARIAAGEHASTTLRDAYVFLRNVEHRLQYRDDSRHRMCRRTPIERIALARAAGFGDAADFDRTLERHRKLDRRSLRRLFGETENDRAIRW